MRVVLHPQFLFLLDSIVPHSIYDLWAYFIFRKNLRSTLLWSEIRILACFFIFECDYKASIT